MELFTAAPPLVLTPKISTCLPVISAATHFYTKPSPHLCTRNSQPSFCHTRDKAHKHKLWDRLPLRRTNDQLGLVVGTDLSFYIYFTLEVKDRLQTVFLSPSGFMIAEAQETENGTCPEVGSQGMHARSWHDFNLVCTELNQSSRLPTLCLRLVRTVRCQMMEALFVPHFVAGPPR